jgi:PAS domain S-box-containing protein
LPTGRNHAFSFFYAPFDRWFEIDFYPSKDGISLFYRDVTDAVRLAAERDALLRRQRQQAALLDLAHDAILALTLDGTIEFWNRGAEQMYGWTAAEAVGQVSHELLRTAFPQPLAEIKQTLLASGSWVGELTHTCRDGTEIVVSSRWALRTDAAGTPNGFLEITRDISDRVRLEDQLRQAAKLESLGVLAGGSAHDFNTLLVGILGNASLALDSLPASWRNSDRQLMKQLLSGVVSGAERAADLTRQLLAFAGKGRFLLELINLSDLVREISTLVQAAIPKHVQLRLELNPDLPPIEADAGQLQQVIMNLVINAAEAIGDHTGTVLVTTSQRSGGSSPLYWQKLSRVYSKAVHGHSPSQESQGRPHRTSERKPQ